MYFELGDVSPLLFPPFFFWSLLQLNLADNLPRTEALFVCLLRAVTQIAFASDVFVLTLWEKYLANEALSLPVVLQLACKQPLAWLLVASYHCFQAIKEENLTNVSTCVSFMPQMCNLNSMWAG